MLLSSFLQPEFFWSSLEGKDERDVLNHMVKTIARHYTEHPLSKDEIIEGIIQREQERPTIIGECFWVPHLRVSSLEDLIIGVAFLKTPLSFAEEKSARVVFLVLTNPTRSSLYLNVLSAISTPAKDPTFLESFCKGVHFDEFCRLLDTRNIRIKKELTIADIMSTEIHVVSPDQNIADVLDLFARYQISYAPVVDKNEKFVAEINMIDIMKVGMPAYTSALPNMNFLSSFEPFEELLQHEKDIPVQKIMRKPEIVLSPETSIIEAIFEFTNHRRRHLPIAKDGRIVGVVSYMDMLNKILRR